MIRMKENYYIKKYYGDFVLLKRAKNKENCKKVLEKVGVYGSNGCGKTTLIKAILAQEEFEGEINISSSRKIGYISQDVIFLIQRSYRYQWSKLKEVSNKIEVKFKSFTSILFHNISYG